MWELTQILKNTDTFLQFLNKPRSTHFQPSVHNLTSQLFRFIFLTMWNPGTRLCILVLVLFLYLPLASRGQFSETTLYQISDGKSKTGTYQAEKAYFKFCQVRTKHKGYSGSGYVDYNGRGAFIEWKIDARRSDNHRISIRYSSINARPAQVILDGRLVGVFDFKATKSWNTWRTETTILYLAKGSHTIKVEAANSAGPNIDWLSVKHSKDSTRTPTKAPSMKPVTLPPTYRPTRKPTMKPMSPQLTDQPTGMPTMKPTIKPTIKPTMEPTMKPTMKPTIKPIMKPTRKPMSEVQDDITIVLKPNEFLSRREWKYSPSKKYHIGLNRNGELIMINNRDRTIWSAGVTGGFRCFMQADGNLIVRDDGHNVLWSSNTSKNYGAKLAISNAGQILITNHETILWMNGIPKGRYTGPSSSDLSFPIRGMFYYPWFPETWTVNGDFAKFEPSLGFYNSGHRQVVQAHIDAMDYSRADLSIASWWGPGTNLDRSRITLLMDETIAMESQIKWSVYYEEEREEDAPPDAIREDLDYLKKWFAWHPAFAHIDGRPVIFVYNEKGCNVADRWVEANDGEWYVVLKLFKGFRNCANQPDSWHQYGPAVAVNQVKDFSFSISPGFWRADMEEPLLPRVSKDEFCANTKQMTSSGDPWQLITTFNEAGEGTMVEASHHWSSDTIYGNYLDCLHKYYK